MDITLWHIIIPPLVMSASVIAIITLFRRVRRREAQQRGISAGTAGDNTSMQGEAGNSSADGGVVAVSISQESAKEPMSSPKGDEHIIEQVAEREKMLIKRIAADPRDVEAYDLLGQVYLVQGSLRDAAECFNQVVAFDPHNLRAVEQLNKIKKIVQDSEDSE